MQNIDAKSNTPRSLRRLSNVNHSSPRIFKSASSTQVPNYAQPTFSFVQHSTSPLPNTIDHPTVSNDSKSTGNTLRAGNFKTVKKDSLKENRPTKCVDPKDHILKITKARNSLENYDPKTKTDIEPSFVQIFNTPIDNNFNSTPESLTLSNILNGKSDKNNSDHIVPHSQCSAKSSTYRSPRLLQNIEGKFRCTKDLKSVVDETDILIEKFCIREADDEKISKLKMLSLSHNKKFVSVEQWKTLVQYHFEITEKLQEKLKDDAKLIQNLLELNNWISTENKASKAFLDQANEKISHLFRELQLKKILSQSESNDYNYRTPNHSLIGDNIERNSFDKENVNSN
ncbi:hypothetical protein WICMUC_004759 [Wickerhamomyces mucosus]|uniref:Uncharacterized protein n=1 Tax=Wickerhamomyces mucosus TaxID=1378264 RepID=A0A9P8PG53_9ASCO|nr:hypothetical protein WICMUC_004759 [Wickerhamomyces mucosus]